MNKLSIYQSVVKTLQNNDRNATYDEILADYDNNLDEAIEILKSCLVRIINEENLEGEELEFYKIQLARVHELQ